MKKELLMCILFSSGLEISSEMWTLIGVVVGGLIAGIFSYHLQKSQFKHNKEMFFLQNMSREKAKEYLLELLNHKKYPERKFTTLRKRIGAFSDDELRILLTEIDALTSKNEKGEELWYLKSRNNERKKPSKEGYI